MKRIVPKEFRLCELEHRSGALTLFYQLNCVLPSVGPRFYLFCYRNIVELLLLQLNKDLTDIKICEPGNFRKKNLKKRVRSNVLLWQDFLVVRSVWGF